MKIVADHWFFRPFTPIGHVELEIPNRVAHRMQRIAQSAFPKETGGLVLGWWEGKIPIIHCIVEVADPVAGPTRWQRNERAASLVLKESLFKARVAHLGYIGDWHSHPENVGPSATDIASLRRVSRQYPQAVVLLVLREGGFIDTRLAKRGLLTTPHRLDTSKLSLNPVKRS